MNKSEKAIRFFETMNCNQAVFAAFGPDFGVSEELCIRLGLSFGGGMGRQGKTCGVVTGAYSVIGLWAAEQSDQILEQKQIAAKKVKEFNQLFVNKYKYLECKDLLGFDISIPEEASKIKELNLSETLCPKFVGIAAELLEEILK